MSSWIHVNAAIRIDDLRLDDSVPDFDELIGKECLFDSPESVWDDMAVNPDLYLPMGSEGTLQKSVWVNPDKSYAAAYTVTIFGDLRDCDEKVIEWFKGKCTEINVVRDAIITVRVNANKPLIFVYDHFKKYRDKNMEEENEETKDNNSTGNE